jgi:hypothetical protein
VSFTRSQLNEPAKADSAYFDKRGASVKNALVSELKNFWPTAADVWPKKFQYAERERERERERHNQGLSPTPCRLGRLATG